MNSVVNPHSPFRPPIDESRRFDDRLAFDVALTLEGSGFDLQEILSSRSLTRDQFIEISLLPLFQRKVAEFREEIKAKGLTFKLKARAQAEELLGTSWRIIHDVDVPASVKADLIKSTVKWAGLEPKGETLQDSGAGGGVRILINLGNLGGPQAPLIVEHSNAAEGEDS